MFIDYNLYGMNLIQVAAAKFRHNTDDGKISLGFSRTLIELFALLLIY